MIETDLHYAPEEVTPPGATLNDLMEERGLTQAELSRRLKRPPQAINEIIAGKKEITEDTALELERVLQVPAHFWLARDARYREHLARLRDAELRQAQVPWVETFPLKNLQSAGVLPAGRLTPAFKQQLVDHLLRFFGVASPQGWAAQYDSMQAQFRRARPERQTDTAAITAWLRMGELAASRQVIAAHSASALQGALPQLRALTLLEAPRIGPELTRLCAAAGVHLVLVPPLPGTHVAGVARWVGGKPLIQLSLLGKWNDGFWFSFFHEVAHILKHPQRKVYLDDAASGEATQAPEEIEANRFAAEVLIPSAQQRRLAELALTPSAVKAFARAIELHPGIVVGQLQHRGRVGYAHPLTKLKARYEVAP